MAEADLNDQHAYDYVRMLSETIGPRPAGSQAERRAMDFLQQKLVAVGYTVQRSPVAFAPEMPFSPMYSLGGILLILAGVLFPITVIPAILLPFVFALLPQLSRWMIRQRKTSRFSENLFAILPEAEKPHRVVFCAHVDSGKMSGLSQPFLIRIYHELLFYGQRIAIFMALLGLVRLLGFHLPVEIFLAIKVLVLCIGLIWFVLDVMDQVGSNVAYTPGANDNASGVGVALELAELTAHKPHKPFDVAFLFTGAEETGLHGAEAFASRLDPERDVVINLDMVGAGDQLNYVTADGTVSPLRTDSQLNQVILKAEKNARGIWYTVRSGDFAAFLRHGIRAASLELRGGRQTSYHYHTRHDQIHHIEPESLAYMIRFLKFFLAFYEDEFIE